MGQIHAYAAVDLGAESGRVVKGILDEGKLHLEEIGRFKNGLVPLGGQEHWNLVGLYASIMEAFKRCARSEIPIESIGVDSWGVDFVLLAEDDSLMGLPVAYRDRRTDGMMEKMFEKMPKKRIYEKTGIEFMKFNSLYQLLSLSEAHKPYLPLVKHFLMIPDYFHFLFTGTKTNEYTNASTTQLLNVQTGDWDEELLDAICVPRGIFKELLQPATVIGPITRQVQEATGLGPIPVVAPGTHDTASAIASIPADGDGNWAYISSGTWSLMGIEADRPMVTQQAYDYTFTNEGGVFGTIRFHKNIMGLWLVQRCRAAFESDRDYTTLTRMAADAPAFVSLIDPNHDDFLNPTSMTAAIDTFCRKTGQPVPASEGAYVRCCLESLALQYRRVLERLGDIYETAFEKIHIVGGGTQNTLLNQFTADATGTTVVAGPVEATVIGNLVMQAIGLGHISDLAEGRRIIRNSFELETFLPQQTDRWDRQYERFTELKSRSSIR